MEEAGADNPVELDQTRVGRLSRINALQQQAMVAGLRERLMLKRRRLEAALLRIEDGSYSICCKCDEMIAAERLQTDLGTPFCTTCQDELAEPRRGA